MRRFENDTVLLVGIDTPIGLNIIRELDKDKISVIGIGKNNCSVGAKSKHLEKYYHRKKDVNEFVQQINKLIEEHKANALMAISESDIEILNAHRDQIVPVEFMFAEKEQMDLVLNKDKTYKIAEDIGINIPKTFKIKSLSEFENISNKLDFPVVIKWSNPQDIIKKLSKSGVVLEKAEYAYSLEELKLILKKYEPVGEFPLVQTYCPGHGLGQFFLFHDNYVIRKFQHERIHEWPPEGGVSTHCQSLSLNLHSELFSKSIELLKRINWQGIAMVEYRIDPKSNKSYLMEINGRFWGSYPLAYHSRAKFAPLYYRAVIDGEQPKEPPPSSNIYCRYMIPETKRLMKIFLNPNSIEDKNYEVTRWADLLTYITSFFRMHSRYFVFSITDPKPFLYDVLQALKKPFK